MTAFRPGQSPPPVSTPTRIRADDTGARAARRRGAATPAAEGRASAAEHGRRPRRRRSRSSTNAPGRWRETLEAARHRAEAQRERDRRGAAGDGGAARAARRRAAQLAPPGRARRTAIARPVHATHDQVGAHHLARPVPVDARSRRCRPRRRRRSRRGGRHPAAGPGGTTITSAIASDMATVACPLGNAPASGPTRTRSGRSNASFRTWVVRFAPSSTTPAATREARPAAQQRERP